MSETTPLKNGGSGEDAASLRRLRAYQPWAFFITFGGYMMAHFSRKSYSTIKTSLETSAGFSPFLLSAMDTVFMTTYAVGNVVNGKLGDTFNPTTILAIGLFGSGVCLLGINGLIWFDVENQHALLGNVLMLAFYFVFGFAQATGGPVGTAVMGNWFCDEKSVQNRGTIFGLWTCHQYVGDVTAQLATTAIFAYAVPYWWALTIPSIANLLWAFVTLQLTADPADKGIITPEVRIRQAKNAEKAERGEETDAGPKAIGFVEAFCIPMVANYAIAFGFFKLCNYAFFFWLPYFLANSFTDSEANFIASAYSFGMMPGGIIVGAVSDCLGGRRATVIGIFMFILMCFLGVFAAYSQDLTARAFGIMLFCMGTLVGGPNNIITSAVAADLATHESVKGSSKAIGTVTGLINGTGSAVSALGLLAIGPLQARFGWSSVWYFMIGSTFIGTCLMGPKIKAELSEKRGYTEISV